jgi:Molecular chaperone
MPGRLGVDFGTSNTVVALWNESSNESSSLQLKDYGHSQDTENGSVFVVPSLIHYAENDEFFYGNQVLKRNLYHSPRTFQWMKRFISRRNGIFQAALFLDQRKQSDVFARGTARKEGRTAVPNRIFYRRQSTFANNRSRSC